MALGLLPVIGVPLPFLSYGGSALLSNMIMVGLLLNLYAHRKEY
jgi:rod shape determining protein RodA